MKINININIAKIVFNWKKTICYENKLIFIDYFKKDFIKNM